MYCLNRVALLLRDRGCLLSFFTSLFRHLLLPINRRFRSLLIFSIRFVLNVLRFSFFLSLSLSFIIFFNSLLFVFLSLPSLC